MAVERKLRGKVNEQKLNVWYLPGKNLKTISRKKIPAYTFEIVKEFKYLGTFLIGNNDL